jgi:hypothetical protein
MPYRVTWFRGLALVSPRIDCASMLLHLDRLPHMARGRTASQPMREPCLATRRLVNPLSRVLLADFEICGHLILVQGPCAGNLTLVPFPLARQCLDMHWPHFNEALLHAKQLALRADRRVVCCNCAGLRLSACPVACYVLTASLGNGYRTARAYPHVSFPRRWHRDRRSAGDTMSAAMTKCP